MKLNPNCPISEERIEKYESFIERINGLIEKSKLPLLYCVLLQASFELDENKDFFSTNSLKKFTGKLLSKFLNEGWAIIGCFERAAFLSNYHHTRAALELAACYHWVIYKDNKIEKRVKKYFEFKDLFLYQLYIEYNNKPDKEYLPFLNSVDANQINYWETKIAEWIKLYSPKDNNLLEIRNWHYCARIENILAEFPNTKLKMFYEEFSHATHFSPFSHSLGTDNTVLGLPINIDGDLSEINRPLTIYLDSFEFLLSWINKATAFNSKVKFPRDKSD